MYNLINNIFTEVCLDERISDGIFDMSNNVHMEALMETLVDTFKFPLNDAKTLHNKMLEGKYPERQAYNKDGLLVTFPTPQHKQKAIQRGTHFEQNPVSGQQNVFGSGGGTPQQPQPQQPSAPPKPAPQKVSPKEEPKDIPSPQTSQLPASDVKPVTSPSPSSGQSSPSALPPSDQSSDASDKQPLEVEPPESSALSTPPPPNFDAPKPQQQRAAEAEVVKRIMRGDDTDPSLNPTITERRLQLKEVFEYAKRMGYKEAMLAITEVMNT